MFIGEVVITGITLNIKIEHFLTRLIVSIFLPTTWVAHQMTIYLDLRFPKKPKPSVSIFHLVRPNTSKLGFVTSDNYSSEMFNSWTQKTNDAVSFHKKIREAWKLHYKYPILGFFLGSFSIVMLGLAYMRFTKHHN